MTTLRIAALESERAEVITQLSKLISAAERKRLTKRLAGLNSRLSVYTPTPTEMPNA